jgi:LTXXQ motif family protein
MLKTAGNLVLLLAMVLWASRPGAAAGIRTGFGPPIEQLIRGCNQEAIELTNSSIDLLVKVIGPNDDQRNGIEQMHNAAAEAGNELTAACPKEVPAALPARLEALEHVLDSFAATLDAVRPTMESLYHSLDDEQKARLVAMYMANNAARQPSDRTRSARDTRVAAGIPESGAICGQWAEALRDWPVRQIETSIRLSDYQRAALYELTAAFYRAAGTLGESCPTEVSFTPLGQIGAKRKRLGALRQAIGLVHTPLDRFVEALDVGQRTRLAAIVNSTR